jgi:glycogen debranching enzyme
MTSRTKFGGSQMTLHQGYAVAVSGRDGQIGHADSEGVYYLDTRLISAWHIFVNGQPWTLLGGGTLSPSAGRVYFVNPALSDENGPIPEKSVGLVLARHLDGGLHEDIEIANYGAACRIRLEIAVEGDFADLFEVKSHRVVRRGAVRTEWDEAAGQLTTCYRNRDFSRGFRIRVRHCEPPPMLANGRLCFSLRLEPGAAWHACLLYDFADGEVWIPAPALCVRDYESGEAARARAAWLRSVVKVEADHAFADCFRQSLDDMAALRLPIEGTDQVKFVPAAGLPWYAALFGRDSLVISLQTAIVHPEFALGALEVLGRWQARERDDYRDAEPGKILHELRRGELAHFKLIPHTPYYGSADATPLYLITLHSAFMASGDTALLREHLETAEACLRWIDLYGDRDGDGFQEYQTRSADGYENQSWKDSGEALVDDEGKPVKGLKATCELQGYVYDAWLRMAQLYDHLGRHAQAGELRERAQALFERFNAHFWNAAEGTYVFALDGDKRQVRSVVSNPGHCLWSGIVPPERARQVADRLMAADMWSGWGIRTLSAAHKSFNPYHYQIGSVWPHDNGLIAQGMKRYGFHAEFCEIAGAVTAASSFFEKGQIPELYAGLAREPGSLPARYPEANVPQGWAAGSLFSLLQALLGFQPDGPAGRLYVDPFLPDWMADLTVRDLRVGAQTFDIRFRREKNGTSFEVMRGPKAKVRARPMRDWAERLRARTDTRERMPQDSGRF